ncbi:hypothetical protein I3J27_02140 [Bradyrhizobium xenonodulans]|uniref:Uncharacterized protein n=1 Tax=Bradyrhizobium xenonodulans TaxID=2736875 RepID=A0ABY7MWQ8_9BRAD|nr:hypothetical protein [Bradyrhizobium xenonodulans]WBL82851.1 hypothetical protein I3J27_02140 [Bradyrhizobium xenonodulans]
MQQKQRFAPSGANQVEIGAIGLEGQVLHRSSSGKAKRFQAKRTPVRAKKTRQNKNPAGAGLKEAADFPLSRLVWPAILAY